MEAMIKSHLEKIGIDKEIWELGVELLKENHSNEVEQSIKAREQFKREYDKVERDIEKLLQLRLNEEITADEYSEAKKLLLDKKIKIEQRKKK